MSRVLMIGAGGVATVAAFKIAQNADVFTEFMIASRRKAKCDKIVEDIHKAGYNMDIKTAQVDADDVEQLKALFNDFKPGIQLTTSPRTRHTLNTLGNGPIVSASSRQV